MRRITTAALFVVLCQGAVAAAERTKVTVLVRGVHCDACVDAVRRSLSSVKAVQIDPQDVVRGEQPRYFSEPFVVEVGDSLENGIGALAKATAALPEGDSFPVVLQIKDRPIAKYVSAKFQCDLRDCPTCDQLEYACTCDHHDHDE